MVWDLLRLLPMCSIGRPVHKRYLAYKLVHVCVALDSFLPKHEFLLHIYAGCRFGICWRTFMQIKVIVFLERVYVWLFWKWAATKISFYDITLYHLYTYFHIYLNHSVTRIDLTINGINSLIHVPIVLFLIFWTCFFSPFNLFANNLRRIAASEGDYCSCIICWRLWPP